VLPLALATGVMGVSFGVLAYAAGWGVVAPIVFSVVAFSGTAQFAVVSVLGGGGGALAAIVAAVLLNARYAPMSLAAGPWFHGPPWRRLFTSQLIVDESWALAARDGGRFDIPFLLGAGLTLYPVWVGGTAIGVLAGDFVGDPERLGLDAAFPALFLGLLAGVVEGRRAKLAAALGGAIAIALVPLAPAGVPIIAAAAACLIGLRR
jgi:4-azaleucine resistance transporter AzlC